MTSQRNKRAVVEAGEASESDEGESELFRVKPQTSTTTSAAVSGNPLRAALSRQGISVVDGPVSSLTAASSSVTSVSQELPARPVPCRALVETNCSLAKGIRETAALPYAVAVKEIDDIALDLVRGQQLIDDVYRVLESVGKSLQNIEREADELRAQCSAALPVAPVAPPPPPPSGHTTGPAPATPL